MCTKEDVREVLREEFNGDFIKTLPVALANIQSMLQEQTRAHETLLSKVEVGFAGNQSRQDVANGRTKTSEIRIAQAMFGLSIIAMMVLPILSWALFTLVNIGDTIDARIDKSLSTYEFVISE